MFPIVRSALNDLDRVAVHAIDKPVFGVYSSRPVARKFVLERFGLSVPAERIAEALLGEFGDFRGGLFIR